MAQRSPSRALHQKRAASVVDFLLSRDVVPAQEAEDNHRSSSPKSVHSADAEIDAAWRRSSIFSRKSSRATQVKLPREPLVSDSDRRYIETLHAKEALPPLDINKIPKSKILSMTKPHAIPSKQPHFYLSRSRHSLANPTELMHQSLEIARIAAAAEQILEKNRRKEKRSTKIIARVTIDEAATLDKRLSEILKKEKEVIEKRLAKKPSYMQGNASTKARQAERPPSRASLERMQVIMRQSHVI